MKIVQINATCGVGSTGKICVGISRLLSKQGVENYILYSLDSDGYSLGKAYMDRSQIKIEALKSKVLGNYGFNTKRATERLLLILDEISPDVVHLHNLHSHNCHLEKLFSYLKEKRIKVIWTFHDCWAFTGYCPHFDYVGCEKWMTECGGCPLRSEFSWFFDRSRKLFLQKKELFSGLDLTIVTPSRWLADVVGRSFLRDCPIKVIPNGIDLTVFMPTESDFRTRYGCENKKLVLGVSFGWDERKGLDVMIRLARELPDDYRLALVGTDEKTDALLPKNVISVHRTADRTELAGIYTAADVFANATREDTFPTVNMEAIACGTPVVTFNTGGSAEMLDETVGTAVEKNDFDALLRSVKHVCETRCFTRENCLKKADSFEENNRFSEYMALYAH